MEKTWSNTLSLENFRKESGFSCSFNKSIFQTLHFPRYSVSTFCPQVGLCMVGTHAKWSMCAAVLLGNFVLAMKRCDIKYCGDLALHYSPLKNMAVLGKELGIYTASQKHESTLLHTYVLNKFLTADHSWTAKYFWKNFKKSW